MHSTSSGRLARSQTVPTSGWRRNRACSPMLGFGGFHCDAVVAAWAQSRRSRSTHQSLLLTQRGLRQLSRPTCTIFRGAEGADVGANPRLPVCPRQGRVSSTFVSGHLPIGSYGPEEVLAICVLHIGQGPIAYLSADCDVPMKGNNRSCGGLQLRNSIAAIHESG